MKARYIVTLFLILAFLMPQVSVFADGIASVAEPVARLEQQPVGALSTAGPDAYGYSWDDAEPYNWIPGSYSVYFVSDSAGSSPIGMNFEFEFYGNRYKKVYVSQYGYLTFELPPLSEAGSDIPGLDFPNNLVAPYRGPLQLLENSDVLYSLGGTQPNRYLAVSWVNMVMSNTGDSYTFEAILYENGEIVFQYKKMQPGSLNYCGAAGIENAYGSVGLAYLPYCQNPFDLDLEPANAVRFTPPATSAKVNATPKYAGNFTAPGKSTGFFIDVVNTGDWGEDSYDISVNSSWPVTVYDATGTTEITNTGVIPQGGSITCYVVVETPSFAVLGDENTALITFTSGLKDIVRNTVSLYTAVPPRFVQSYIDVSASTVQNMLLLSPRGETAVDVSPGSPVETFQNAVQRLSNGNIVYFWSERKYKTESIYYADLWYKIVSPSGEIVRDSVRLTDNSGFTNSVGISNFAIASGSNGSIYILWQSYLAPNTSQMQYAVIDGNGNTITSPISSSDFRREISIGATTDDRFVAAWDGYGKIYFAVYTNTGMQFTLKELPVTGCESPSVISLNSTKALLVYTCYDDIYYRLVYSNGTMGVEYRLTTDGSVISADESVDGILLQNGSIALAWEDHSARDGNIRFAVLDKNLNISVASTELHSPYGGTNAGVSVTTDAFNHIIITWLSNDNHLYYALVDASSTILTHPMPFYASDGYSFSDLLLSYSGAGNAPYSLFGDVPHYFWSAPWIERLANSGVTGGCATSPNLMYCPGNQVTRAQMAIFLLRAKHGSDYVPPAATGIFGDVPAGSSTAPWIEQLYKEGVTGGCSTTPLLYCPNNPVTRAQMAIFLLRAEHGSDYVPPAAKGIFGDVPPTSFTAPFIEQLSAEGITGGCSTSPLMYCPTKTVTRDQMAVFLVRTFNLP